VLSELNEVSIRQYLDALVMYQVPGRGVEEHIRECVRLLSALNHDGRQLWLGTELSKSRIGGSAWTGLALTDDQHERVDRIMALAKDTAVGKLLDESGAKASSQLRWWIHEYSRAKVS
jgi:hypothetical protein